MNIEIKRMNSIATLVFSDFYITRANQLGSESKEYLELLVNKFLTLVVVMLSYKNLT